jgi:hypothetical protein
MKLLSGVAIAVSIGIGVLTAQAEDKTLSGSVTIKTSGYTTAVHGKLADAKQGEFLFCIDQDRSGAAQPVNFTGPARVIYRPIPVTGMPPGVVITGPENVASTLTVIAENGATWVFTAKGQKPLLPAGGAALVKPTAVSASIVRRTDWAAAAGQRRGADISSCLAPAG